MELARNQHLEAVFLTSSLRRRLGTPGSCRGRLRFISKVLRGRMTMPQTKMILAAGATFALAASAHAAQKTVAFNVAPGSCGAPIAVPANNRPVILAGTNTQQTDR